MRLFFSKRGFTLIEILVVIAIIGILSAGLIATINPLEQLKKARDAQRKADLAQIQKALDLYNMDHGSYPPSVNFSDPNALAPYAVPLPKDPSDNQTYVYQQTQSGQGYRLYAQIERCSKDSQKIPDAVCTTDLCDYGVTSPNESVTRYDNTPPGCGNPEPTPLPTSTPMPTLTDTPIPTLGPTNTPTPTPTSTPTPVTKYVFVIRNSESLAGNSGDASFFDNACQFYGGTSFGNNSFIAWISTNTTSAAQRVNPSNDQNRKYALRSGTVIAANWNQLLSGNLQHQIDQDDTGTTVSNQDVWTGTNANGASSGNTCNGWSSSGSGTVGKTGSADPNWTNNRTQPCTNSKIFYCFEQ